MAHAQANFRSNNIHAQGGVYFNTTSNNTHTHIHSPPPPAASWSCVNPQLLIKACRDGNARLAKELLNQMNPSDVNYADPTDENNTALHLAVKANDLALVQVLLQGSLIDVNARDKALLLLTPGVNPNLRNMYGERHGDAALHAAAFVGHLEAVKLLLRHTNIAVNIRNHSGATPLIVAARSSFDGNPQIMHELLAHPNIDVNAMDAEGTTALHPLSVHAFLKLPTAKALLGHHNVNPNIRDVNGQAPLMYASDWGLEAFARLLLAHPRTDVNIRDNKGQTALSLALDCQNLGMSRMLLDRGAVMYDKPIKDSECRIA